MDNIKDILAEVPFMNIWPLLSNNLNARQDRKRPTFSSTPSSNPPLFKDLGPVDSAPLDSKRYKVIQLRNGLKICLVSTCVHETSTPPPNDSILFKSCLSNKSSSSFFDQTPRSPTSTPPDSDDEKSAEFLENKIKFFNDTKSNSKDTGIIRAPKPASATAPEDIPPPLPVPPSKVPKLIKCCSKGPCTVSVCVGAGSFHDPSNLNGLAHFVEHLIFLGSKQYPEPNTLFTKVFENGGAVNATTYAEYTNFYFQCKKSSVFEECVSILVDGLTNPLFKKHTIQKEIEAVDSEYSIKMTHDLNRVHDFLRNRANLGHPFQKFYWGNKKTLNKPYIFEQVRKWKERYYRANYMTACIQAPMSIEDLERFAVDHFSDIPSSPPDWKSPIQEILEYGEPYSKDNFQTAYFIAPISHLNCILITWALPAKFWQSYQTKPLDYIQYLLETTSKGGLKDYLRKKQYITEWSNLSINYCARDDYCRNSYCSMFTLSISLTDLGYETNLGVIQAVYSYFKMLRRGGIRPYIYQEMQRNAENKFHYKNWEEMLQTGVDIAVNMQTIQNIPDLLSSMTLMSNFDPTLIEEALGLMTATSANYVFVSRKNIPFCKDSAMPSKISFCKIDITSDIYDKFENTEIYGDFGVPGVGTFSPKEIRLMSGDGSGGGYKFTGTLYQDNKLLIECTSNKKIPCVSPRVPTTSIYVSFASPIVIGRTSRMKFAVMDYWTRLLNDRIVEQMGGHFEHLFVVDVHCSDEGVGVHVAGPRDHIVELLTLVVREFFGDYGKQEGDELKFARDLKVDKVREYMNDIYDVEMLSEDLREFLKVDNRPSYFELRNELLDVSLEGGDLSRLIERFRKRMMVNVDISGEMTTGEADGIVKLFTGKSCGTVNYKAPRFMPEYESRSTVLPLGTSLLAVRAVHPAYVTSVVTNFYQMNGWGEDDFRTGDFVIALFHLLRRRFANQLRTVEQLGYTTRLIPMYDPDSGPIGIYAIAYTHPHKYSTWHVDARIDGFFRSFYENWLGSEKVRDFLKMRFFDGKDADKLLKEFDNFYKDNLLKEGTNFRKLSFQLQAYIPGRKIPTKVQDKLTKQGAPAEGGEGGDQGGKGKGLWDDLDGDHSDSLIALEYLDMDDQYKTRMKRENLRMITNIGQFKRTLELLPI